MAETSNIAWTDSTFNPVIGCTKVSPGCDNCYAEELMDKRYGRVEWGPHGDRVRTKTWGDPIRWNDRHNDFFKYHGRRRRVFCASLADVFDNQWDVKVREDLWSLIRKCTNLDWQLLTKRPQNFKKMLPPDWGDGWLHVWLGCTAENQEEAGRRVPILLNTPAAIRFISAEPLLGQIDFTSLPNSADLGEGQRWLNALGDGRRGFVYETTGDTCSVPGINWIIVGGESGKLARPFNMAAAALILEDCIKAGVPVFMKQLGARPEIDGVPFKTSHKKGDDIAKWPESMRVQQFPESRAA